MSENEKKSIRERFAAWTQVKAIGMADGLDSWVGRLAKGTATATGQGGLASAIEPISEGIRMYGEKLFEDDVEFFESTMKNFERQTRSEIAMSMMIFEGDYHMSESSTNQAKSDKTYVEIEGVNASPQFKGMNDLFKAPKEMNTFSFDKKALDNNHTNSQIDKSAGVGYFTTTWNNMVEDLRSGELSHDDVHVKVDAPPYVYDINTPGERTLTQYHFTGENLERLVDEVSSKYVSYDRSYTGINAGKITHRRADFKAILDGTLSYINNSYNNPDMYNDVRSESQPKVIKKYLNEIDERYMDEEIYFKSGRKMFDEDQYAKSQFNKMVVQERAENERAKNNRKSYGALNAQRVTVTESTSNNTKNPKNEDLYNLEDDDWELEM